jgi:hypothetical protein
MHSRSLPEKWLIAAVIILRDGHKGKQDRAKPGGFGKY